MKDKNKELFKDRVRYIIRFLLCTIAHTGVFLFVAITGVSILPIIYNNNPFASQIYAYTILITSILIIYKWIEILVGKGMGIRAVVGKHLKDSN